MKNFLITVALLSLLTHTLPAQDLSAAAQKSSVGGNLGMTFIDGEPYYLFSLAPDLAFGKWGVGLDVNLRFNKEGKIRTADLTAGKIIRYIRYGTKGDDLYGRIGLLDYARLGNGFILGNYRNTASYDLRRTGLELDVRFDEFGFETVLSDFASPSVLGTRAYVLPFRFTTLKNTPLIKNIEVGATFVGDFKSDADRTTSGGIQPINKNTADDGGTMPVIGFDIGLPIIAYSWINSRLYFDYAKIIEYGSGTAVGINLNLRPAGLLQLGLQYERRFLGEQFIPQYFNALYEKSRYTPLTDSTATTKAQELRYAGAVEGNYAEITLNILGAFIMNGQYYSPVGIRNAGEFHARIMPGFDIPGGFQFDAGMDRKKVGRVFVLDENTLLYARFGYKLNPFTIVSMLYEYTYAPVKNANGETIRFEQQVRVEPRVGFFFSF